MSFSPPQSGPEVLPPGVLEGIDVAGAIQYYSSRPDIPIHLVTVYGSKTYTDTTLETDPYPYDFSYAALFMTHIVSENLEIQEITFEKMED